MKDGTIGVLVVDDHSIVRQGIYAVLESSEEVQVIGEAADGAEAVEQALALNPDVILMDIEMPRKNGISAIQDIIRQRPGSRILVLSGFSEDAQIVESMRAGARGYMLKSAKTDELVDAIYKVYAGEMPLNPFVADRLVDGLTMPQAASNLREVLTKRELEIIPMVGSGMKNKEISERLGISERTVGTHVSHMIRKAGVENRVQLAMLAVQQGLTSPYNKKGK